MHRGQDSLFLNWTYTDGELWETEQLAWDQFVISIRESHLRGWSEADDYARWRGAYSKLRRLPIYRFGDRLFFALLRRKYVTNRIKKPGIKALTAPPLDPNKPSHSEVSMFLLERWILEEYGDFETRRHWEEFKSVHENHRLFILVWLYDTVCVIPKRAFSSPEEVAAARTLFQEKIGPITPTNR